MRVASFIIISAFLFITSSFVFCDVSPVQPEPGEEVQIDEDYQTKTTTFESQTIESMREMASNLTQCPAIDDYYSDANTMQSKDGWIIYPCDPTLIISAFPHLTFHPDKKIGGYYFREGIGGNAILSVVDKDEEITIPENMSNYSIFLNLPPGDRDYLVYVDGDKSPQSYLEASVLYREIPDIGAFWHGISWGTHTILDDNLVSPSQDIMGEYGKEIPDMTELSGPEWNWSFERPISFNPSVTILDTKAIVEFYSYSGLHQEKIIRHTDTYTNDSYNPDVEDLSIATGPLGFVF